MELTLITSVDAEFGAADAYLDAAAAPSPSMVRISPHPPTTFAVTLPPGATAGQTLQATTPDGQLMNFQIPEGVAPGQSLEIAYTAALGPPVPVPQHVTSPHTIQFVVPPGVGPGMTIQLSTPDGQTVQVQVPATATPGSSIQVPYTPRQQPGGATSQQAGADSVQHAPTHQGSAALDMRWWFRLLGWWGVATIFLNLLSLVPVGLVLALHLDLVRLPIEFTLLDEIGRSMNAPAGGDVLAVDTSAGAAAGTLFNGSTTAGVGVGIMVGSSSDGPGRIRILLPARILVGCLACITGLFAVYGASALTIKAPAMVQKIRHGETEEGDDENEDAVEGDDKGRGGTRAAGADGGDGGAQSGGGGEVSMVTFRRGETELECAESVEGDGGIMGGEKQMQQQAQQQALETDPHSEQKINAIANGVEKTVRLAVWADSWVMKPGSKYVERTENPPL